MVLPLSVIQLLRMADRNSHRLVNRLHRYEAPTVLAMVPEHATAPGAVPPGERPRQPLPGWLAEGCSARRVRFREPFQTGQCLLRSALQFSSKQVLDQPTPPPGREREISTELRVRPAISQADQREVFVVDDAERHRNLDVQTAPLDCDGYHGCNGVPTSTKRARRKVQPLPSVQRALRSRSLQLGCRPLGPLPRVHQQ